ncbi:MAG TPA: hypothetical protein VGN91_25475 [Bosea sp. (in: a-proteobacteria)]|jgi:hypothetical protein|nr:hypothetical protein [Bosea sp. (in: a-proteobacteria)]
MTRPDTTREDIAVMAKVAGLDLSPGLFDELVDAYRLIEPSLQRLRRSRDRRDEPAHIYDPRAFMAADG